MECALLSPEICAQVTGMCTVLTVLYSSQESVPNVVDQLIQIEVRFLPVCMLLIILLYRILYPTCCLPLLTSVLGMWSCTTSQLMTASACCWIQGTSVTAGSLTLLPAS